MLKKYREEVDLEALNSRFTEARHNKDLWLSQYAQLYQWVIPNRDAMNVKFNYIDTGKPVTENIWDDTAVLAAYQRANDLHGLLLPKDRTWGKFVLDPHLNTQDEINRYARLVDMMNDRTMYYLNQSNMARVISTSNLDLCGGTAAVWIESPSDRVPLYFRSIAACALYIEYTTEDVVDNCWYATKIRGGTFLREFPSYDGHMVDQLRDNPNEITLLCYGQIKLDEDKYYIYAFLQDDPLTVLFERTKSYKQIIVYRDRVRPGEAEGRGVGTDLLPTIRDVNHLKRDHRKSFAFKANPPMFYDAEDYINPYSIRQWAGAFIPRNPNGRNPLEAMNMPSTPEVFEEIRELQNTIRSAFQVDPLGEINSPVKTATEISIRENRAQRTSATDIARLINELPKQIWETSAKMLNERSLLVNTREMIPEFEEQLHKLRFDYVSPLYDLQNQTDLNHLITNLQFKQQFMGAGAAMASLDLVETNRFLTEKLNLPHKLFLSDEQLRNVIANMAQAAQQQQTLPSSSTTAGQVDFPQDRGVTI